MSTHQHAGKETYVYRLFNADRELIYIGCTHDVEARINAHKASAWWYPQVYFSSVTNYPDRTTGHAAEMKAIATENPKWNIRHRTLGTPEWTEQMYLDYIKAVQMTGAQYAFHRRCVTRAERLLSSLQTPTQRKEPAMNKQTSPQHRAEPNEATLEFWRFEANMQRLHGVKPEILPGFGKHRAAPTIKTLVLEVAYHAQYGENTPDRNGKHRGIEAFNPMTSTTTSLNDVCIPCEEAKIAAKRAA